MAGFSSIGMLVATRSNFLYLEDHEDVYRDIIGDTEGQNALIAALKEKGIDFAEEQQKIHRMMGFLDKRIDSEEQN